MTGEVRPVWCWRLRCPSCLPRAAYVRGLAITDAGPERFATLTQVGEDWQQIRGRMRRLAYDLRASGRGVEWVWSVELNPRGTGHHVHLWERGAYLPQRKLAAAADAVGMGSVTDVRAWRSKDGDSADYGMKAVGYGMKSVSDVASAAAYLECNGMRLTHQSRGFFGGRRVKECEHEALVRRRAHPWRFELVSESELLWDRRGGRIDAHRTWVRGRS